MKKLIAILALCASAQSPLWAGGYYKSNGAAAEYTRMLIMQQQAAYSTRETIVVTDPNRRQPSRTLQLEHYYDRQQPSP